MDWLVVLTIWFVMLLIGSIVSPMSLGLFFYGGFSNPTQQMVDDANAELLVFRGLLVSTSLKKGRIPGPTLKDCVGEIRLNLNDMIEAVREREMPMVNQLDGLASVILNKAVRESLEYDSWITL